MWCFRMRCKREHVNCGVIWLLQGKTNKSDCSLSTTAWSMSPYSDNQNTVVPGFFAHLVHVSSLLTMSRFKGDVCRDIQLLIHSWNEVEEVNPFRGCFHLRGIAPLTTWTTYQTVCIVTHLSIQAAAVEHLARSGLPLKIPATWCDMWRAYVPDRSNQQTKEIQLWVSQSRT